MSIARKFTAGLLTLAMLFSFTACSTPTWASKINGYEVRPGIFIYYSLSAYYEVADLIDSTDVKKVMDSTYEEKNVPDWVTDKATEYTQKFVAIEQKFEELGLTLTDVQKESIKIGASNSFNSNTEFFEKNGVALNTMEDIVANEYKLSAIFDKYYKTDGIEPVSDEELKKFYTENNARVKSIDIFLMDGEGNLFKSDDKAKAMEMAEDYKKRADDGENFDDIIKEYTDYYKNLQQEATGEEPEAEEEEEEEETDTENKYPNEKIITKDGTTPTVKINESVFANRKLGETSTIIVEENEVYYVVQILDILEREDLYAEAKENIVYEIKSEDFYKMIDEWTAGLEVEKNNAAYTKYAPRKLKIEYETVTQRQ